MDGALTARADDPRLAERVAQAAWLDVVDARREAPDTRGVCLAVRAGYLELAFDGIGVTAHFLDRLARAAARIARLLPGHSTGT